MDNYYKTSTNKEDANKTVTIGDFFQVVLISYLVLFILAFVISFYVKISDRR